MVLFCVALLVKVLEFVVQENSLDILRSTVIISIQIMMLNTSMHHDIK